MRTEDMTAEEWMGIEEEVSKCREKGGEEVGETEEKYSVRKTKKKN